MRNGCQCRSLRRLLLPVFVWALVGCGGGSDSGGSSGILATTGGQTVSTSFGGYSAKVYLPPGYEQGNKRYPVIYAMDGDYRFDSLRFALQSSNYNQVILVALYMGSRSQRFAQFPMPGALGFYQFLTEQVIPSVDASYRTDPKSRTLSGHSLSGDFTMLAMYLEIPEKRFFSGFIAADCSCWLNPGGNFVPDWDVPANLESAMFERSRSLPVRLAMSGDSMGNLQRSTAVYQRITQRGYVGLEAKYLAYGVGHNQMDASAFADALPLIFGPPPP